MYTQKIDWSQYSKESQLNSSEKEFILDGILNHNEDKLSLATIQDIFTIKSSSSEFATKAGKLLFLDKIKDKLKSLPYNSVELARVRQFIHRQKAKLGIKTMKTVDAQFSMTIKEPWPCPDCLKFKQYKTQTSIKKNKKS